MIFTILLFILSVSTSSDVVPITVGEIFSISASEKAEWRQGGMFVEITRIMDSRCPENTNCIWAGELSVEVKVVFEEVEELKILTVPAVGKRNSKSTVSIGDLELSFMGEPDNKLHKSSSTEDSPVRFEFVLEKEKGTGDK